MPGSKLNTRSPWAAPNKQINISPAGPEILPRPPPPVGTGHKETAPITPPHTSRDTQIPAGSMQYGEEEKDVE